MISTMKRGSASNIAEAWARYPTIEAARLRLDRAPPRRSHSAGHDRAQRDADGVRGMGGALKADPHTPSARTAARLQTALGNGLPIVIPGALEHRPDFDVIDDPVAAQARAVAVLDRLRREHQPDGGGAPTIQRAHPVRRALAKLWRRVWRGPDAAPAGGVTSMPGAA